VGVDFLWGGGSWLFGLQFSRFLVFGIKKVKRKKVRERGRKMPRSYAIFIGLPFLFSGILLF
jgi:hypothetical protein